MKKIVSVVIFVFFCNCMSSAQGMSTFAPVGAEWWIQAFQSTYDEFKTSVAHQYLSLEELTHEGQECRRIEVFEHVVDTIGEAHKTFLENIYVYNNEDTVFYFSNKYNKFVPLYIFNVAPGDTLIFYIPEVWEMHFDDTFHQLIVDTIYNLEIDGQLLKNVVLKQLKVKYPERRNSIGFGGANVNSSLNGGSYVEKLGCLKGAFMSLMPIFNYTQDTRRREPEILCYNDTSFSVVYNYHNDPVDGDCLYPGKLSVENVFAQNLNPVLVYPNPANDYVQFMLPKGVEALNEVQILDFMGRVVQREILQINDRITITSLPFGIYTIAISLKGEWYYSKLIKQ